MNTEEPNSHTYLDIGVDLDGVLYDFIDALAEWASKTSGREREAFPPAQSWDFYLSWGWSEDDFLNAYRTALRDWNLFTFGGVDEEGVEALRRISRRGHRIHIVTDRGLGDLRLVAEEQTREWLDGYNVPHDSLTVTSDKGAVEVDIFIEDSVHHYAALEAAGRNPIMLTRPWNRDYPAERRVDSLLQFEEAVNRLSTAPS